ncbi:hypothetical protein Taro_056815 [Colocasia esculenta]|uniref:Uncharacterized protein n=1 Tax=Colocasia esculenta TaxID=4460 RepID=A0A843XYI6_COLES|nr:hypothetical protein [Colocasia esculenta]
MSKRQPSFPSYNRTPKHLGCLNTLHPNPRDEFRTCWRHVEELLVAEELWNDHKKLIFFPVASAATCTDSHLEVDQSTLCQYKAVLDRNPRTCPFSARFRRRPYERDGPIGRILWSCRDSIPHHVLNATKRSVATLLPDLTAPSHSSHPSVAFCSRPIATLTGIRCDLTFGPPCRLLHIHPSRSQDFALNPHLFSYKSNRYARGLANMIFSVFWV